MSLNQSSEIQTYQNDAKNLSDDKIKKMLEDAKQYNENLYGNVIVTDPFDPGINNIKDQKYEEMLSINGNPVMASLEIPAINVNLPIYHGTTDEVLQKGVGHLRKTSLPIGGKGTHSVLTGHTGLSSSRLFTDINLLTKGDIFYIHVMNETLAYKIDQIKTVLPTDTSDLKINPNEDYVTLVTCTPYGVNTHRLLVRGTRVPYDDAKEKITKKAVESTWMQEYKRALIIGAVVFVVLLIVYIVIKKILTKMKRLKLRKNPNEISSDNDNST